ncbi:hypothetical protein IC229_06895 [Spirosoma sp. BT702]|uniref:Uncharacterized protein n=1 Tax=Spirosoma profusum TaxID=2771354 RepID=A0A926XYU0_9BACT|nr:hypothetical protein [Spirosoma profusum]MBD2700353.1 hypothetical protein [Spirosoma profusum]
MSAKNFYQTLYQTDQLFRIADESWGIEVVDDVAPATTSVSSDLPGDLEAIALNVAPVTSEPVHVTLVSDVAVTAEPAATVSTNVPEPLPEPAPRPVVPSILPPIQPKPRMPQLNHKVLLLADEELDPSNLLFLEKILKAVNLNIEGVDLLNLHGVKDINFAELLRGKYINHFITFGVPFERLHLDIMMDRYSPVRFEGITFLMADSLPTIEADQNLKKRLWGALQRIFLR